MWILDTFVTILILGICSSILAQEHFPTIYRSIRETSTPRNKATSTRHSVFSGIAAEDIDRLTEEYCEKNGGPTAAGTLGEGWQNFIDCSKRAVNLTELEADSSATAKNGEWDTLMKKYCGKLPPLLQCASDIVESAKPCLDTTGQEYVENYLNVTSSFLEFMCEKDGNSMTPFFAAGGMECMDSKVKTIRQDCVPGPSSNQTWPVENPLWIDLDQLECSKLQTFKACTVGVVRTCGSPIPANTVESIFDFFQTRKSCPHVQSTEASTST